ncbi:MAG: Gfo/Idh/MocA family protein [Chloroflexota bacterium]
MVERLSFGIFGCGVIASTHAQAITSLPEARLVAMADPAVERARELSERFGGRVHGDLEEMLIDEDLDVVCVCTASGRHGEHACAVMRSGRHVIVEKPIEIRLDAIDEVLRVQRETGVKLSVISQHRFDPAVQRLHRLVQEDAFGRLVLAGAHVLWWRSQGYYDSGAWRGTRELDGGGVLMNQGIHSIDVLQWLMGPVDRVSAYAGTLAHTMETEDTVVAALRFRSGALGTIVGTTAAYPGVTTRLEIFGDHGSAIVERDRLRYLRLSSDGAEEVGAYGLENEESGEPPAVEALSKGRSAHALQIADMIRAIREDATPLVDGPAARHAVAIILAIYRSAAEGRDVWLT